VVRYGVAVAISAAALALNLVLEPLIGTNMFPPFLAAVMVATWFGGLGPGLLAAALTLFAADYFFLSPGRLVHFGNGASLGRSLLYLLSAVLIAALGSTLRRAQERAAESAAQAEGHAALAEEREQRLRSLVQSVREYAIVMLDADARILSWSPGGTAVYGYTEAEIVGQHMGTLYPDDPDTVQPADALRIAAERGRFDTEAWRIRKDGSRVWVQVTITASYEPSGALRGFWAISRDITDRRRVQDAIRASETKFRRLLELAPDAVVIVDRQGRMVLVNTEAQKLFGYTENEMLGQQVEILLPERYRGAHVAHRGGYFDAPRTRPMGVGLDLAGRRKDGSTFPVEISLSPMDADEGQLVISTIRDVTERKTAEARITALNEDLQRRVAELAAVNKELEAFSYSVSHDLRAPLRSIDGFSQALLEEYGDVLTGDGADYLRRVRAATQRMGELIDDLLNLSRVTRREMRREPVDLSALARMILAQLAKGDPGRHVEVHVADGLVAWGDPHLLRLALENLLGNAWKFTGKQPAARVEFGMTSENGASAYFVRDNGVGFDMAYSYKLFGAFQRLHAMTEFPGTGIGLATVQRVINRHGGRVWADAALGTGATFYFTL
jgi:PAS domain S-box-containing protein